MSDITTILKHLPALQPAEQIAILELTETRLAALVLRPSPIWTYAIVGLPTVQPQWPQQWQALVDKATPSDIADLRHYGLAPGGRNLSELLATAVTQLLPTPLSHIFPIGALSAGDYVADILVSRFPNASLLPAQPTLSLPSDLTREAIYRAIAQKHPPQAPADYYLKTVALDANSQKLTFKNIPLIKKGETPPSSMSGFLEKRLYRAIAQSPNPTPLLIEIQNEHNIEPVFRRVVIPPSNVFSLKIGFNYLKDALYCELFDQNNNKLSDNPLDSPLPADLPTPQTRRTIDVAFILDGTLRQKRQVFEQGVPVEQWKPDLSEARRFLVNMLQRLQGTSSLDVQAALCLYGDFQNSHGVKYLYKGCPLQTPDDLRDHIERPGSDVLETDDLDYEAALERALRWANPNSNELPWREKSQKFLVVIGYAPPHPPTPTDGKPYAYPPDTLLTHEPFTSPINWQQELRQIWHQQIQVIPVWVPPAELDRNHRCIRHSYNVWYQLGDKHKQQKHRPLEGLQAATEDQLWNKLTTGTSDQLLVNSPIYWPLVSQIHNLRVNVP